jgi:hypothetical protein
MVQQVQIAQQIKVPANITQFITTYQLGVPLAEYKSRPIRTILWGITLIIVGLLLMLALFAGISLTSILLFLFGLGLLATGIYRITVASKNRGTRIYVCSGGLMRIAGDTSEAMRWDQATTLWEVYSGHSYRGNSSYYLEEYKLLATDGNELAIPKVFSNFKQLGTDIKQQIINHLLPGVLAAFNAGQQIHFGEISVGPHGITFDNGQKTIPWNELGVVNLAGGVVMVKKHGHLLVEKNIPITNIPNACVFKALVDAVKSGQQPQMR